MKMEFLETLPWAFTTLHGMVNYKDVIVVATDTGVYCYHTRKEMWGKIDLDYEGVDDGEA